MAEMTVEHAQNAVDEEEDEEELASFVSTDQMMQFGVNAAEVSKLIKAGYTTAGLVAAASIRELAEVKGLSHERAMVLRQKASLADPTKGTEIYGDSATGKTQLCLSLCVRCQLSRADGGVEGRVLYIDTDNTFRPERIVQIAESMGIDGISCLQHIDSVHASSFEQQCEALVVAAGVLAQPNSGEYRLVVLDCIIAHLRAEYAGRGELADRQQSLHAHLRHLKTIAEEFKVAVVVTNQVQAVPDSLSMGGPIVKACGGPIMAHSTTTKIFLKKGRAQQKKASLTHSPFMPPGDCLLSISAAGICDVQEGEP